ncbi:MAG: zf-HC2 domain-containing protein [Dehalococcoidia bacterium]|nr:zf-HC2 domain-containing protein [Dehalococcoidia bacterium]
MLSSYVDWRLDPEESARVEEHLSACRGCREELESLRATVALLRSLPEVTPSKSFALAPVRPLPWRRALPAMRFATATAVLLLVAAFAVDGTDVFEQSGPSDSYYSVFEPSAASEGDAGYWLVPGERHDIVGPENTTVDLVVPDGSDNVCAAVGSLTASGLIYGMIEVVPTGENQLVLTDNAEEMPNQGDVQEFAVVPSADKGESPFAPSCPAETSALDEIVSKQEGEFLNVVPANSDNTVLYAFDLGQSVPAKIRLVPKGDSGSNGSSAAFGSSDEEWWLRPLEYSLIGLVAVLGVATAALWLRQRRAREVSYKTK